MQKSFGMRKHRLSEIRKRENPHCPSSWNPMGENPQAKPRRTKEIQNAWFVLLEKWIEDSLRHRRDILGCGDGFNVRSIRRIRLRYGTASLKTPINWLRGGITLGPLVPCHEKKADYRQLGLHHIATDKEQIVSMCHQTKGRSDERNGTGWRFNQKYLNTLSGRGSVAIFRALYDKNSNCIRKTRVASCLALNTWVSSFRTLAERVPRITSANPESPRADRRNLRIPGIHFRTPSA